MDLKNCIRCKKIFHYVTGDQLCMPCKEFIEEQFQVVKKYVNENPGANINVVAEECEVSIKQIRKWVREERLSFSDDSLVGLECERCGKMIHSGRFCNECAGGLADAMNSAFRKQAVERKPKGSASGKMRFLE